MLAFLGQVPLFSKPARRTRAEIRPRTQFLKEFNASTCQACQSGFTRLWLTQDFGRVYIRLGLQTPGVPEAADRIVIKNLIAETPAQGHGDAAQRMLCNLADKTDVSLLISAEPTAHKSMGYAAVQAWLTKHRYEEMHMPIGLYWRDPNPAPLPPAPEA